MKRRKVKLPRAKVPKPSVPFRNRKKDPPRRRKAVTIDENHTNAGD